MAAVRRRRRGGAASTTTGAIIADRFCGARTKRRPCLDADASIDGPCAWTGTACVRDVPGHKTPLSAQREVAVHMLPPAGAPAPEHRALLYVASTGTGKTFTAAATAKTLLVSKAVKHAVFVCKVANQDQMRHEIQQYLGTEWTPHTYFVTPNGLRRRLVAEACSPSTHRHRDKWVRSRSRLGDHEG